MPPPSNSDAFHLHILPRTFTLLQLSPSSGLPKRIADHLVHPSSQIPSAAAYFVSVTKTRDEISIVTDTPVEDVAGEKTLWRCIKIQGPMELALTGIMHDITLPLKAAGVPIFALSTWNTDWILIPQDKIAHAEEILITDGWTVVQAEDAE